MRVVLQRALEASVTIDDEVVAEIGRGLMLLIGITPDDDIDDVRWLVSKLVKMRIFDDDQGVMNLSVIDVAGEVIAVSQFTLMASTKKGNRPSYIGAARPEHAEPLYEEFKRELSSALGREVQCGRFGGDMKCMIVNDGPVTIIIDSKRRE